MRKAPVGKVYPISPEPPTLIERIALHWKVTGGYCPVCGHLTLFNMWGKNLRETGICIICRSTNRQRQIASLLCAAISERVGFSIHRLSDLCRAGSINIYNTEASGPLHTALSTLPGYVASEYLGPQYRPGEVVNGIRHEDLSNPSFPDCSFDVVLSSDVFEHIPEPYWAHREVWRILRPGGLHIFTVPFHQEGYLDDVLARPGGGSQPLIVKETIYHSDPLRPKGILVYTIFSLEMLVRLRRIGFRTSMYRLYRPFLGILGSNGLVFKAVKDVQSVLYKQARFASASPATLRSR